MTICLDLPEDTRRLDDFTSMLEALFVGPCQPVPRPMRLKTGKCGDEVGLTTGLRCNEFEAFLDILLSFYNNVVSTSERPKSWCKTLFRMLPKNIRPLQFADFRPIANCCKQFFDIQNLCISFTWTTGTNFGIQPWSWALRLR